MPNASQAVRARAGIARLFEKREIFIHDGAALRRVRLSGPVQALVAFLAIALVVWSVFAAIALSRAATVRQDAGLDSLNGRVAEIARAAEDRARRIEQRQHVLAAMLAGEGDVAQLAALLPPTGAAGGATGITAPLAAAEARQRAFVEAVRGDADARYADTRAALRKLGLSPRHLGVGGPYEPIPDDATGEDADPQFRALFESWSRLDRLQQGVMSVPSQKPVDNLIFTSLYGVRSDPFRGGRAMHAGVDIPGPVGTPIYATADGVVARSGWANGYGNLIEIRHGRGIDTRYGHLSRIIVPANSRVKRGQLIGMMGSTGRSTGSHLHYEVRIDGRAVDPTPFLRASDFVLAVQDRVAAPVAQGGPDARPAD